MFNVRISTDVFVLHTFLQCIFIIFIIVYRLIYEFLLCILTGIYEVFVGHKNFYFGKQPDLLPGTETVSLSASCNLELLLP